MINVIVCGISGRMGSRIGSLILENRHPYSMILSGATEADHESTAGFGRQLPCKVETNLSNLISACDVIIDFTSPESTLQNLSIASEHQKPIVIGTTGFSPQGKQAIQSAADTIPICFSPNMSVGVNVLFKLVADAAKLLGDDYDVEVIEAHHNQKKDAPSGTAMKIAEVLTQTLHRDPKKDLCYHREGLIGERKKKQIGMQTIRGGDIVGDHTVMFAGLGERLEITHRATNRDNFARGAILAAQWLVGKPAGLYDMQDVLGLK